MKFSLSTEIIKMAEILACSPALRKLAWGVVVALVLMTGVWTRCHSDGACEASCAVNQVMDNMSPADATVVGKRFANAVLILTSGIAIAAASWSLQVMLGTGR